MEISSLKRMLMQALQIRRGFWIAALSIYFGAFLAGRVYAPMSLPSIVALQKRHPAIAIIQPPPVEASGRSSHDRLRFSARIYQHNVVAIGMNCIIGLFLFPLHLLVAGGFAYMAGVTMYLDGYSGFFFRMLPHSLIEIPVAIFTTAAVTQAGWRLYAVQWREKLGHLKAGVRNLAFVWLVASICLLPAALLEGFGRAWLQVYG